LSCNSNNGRYNVIMYNICDFTISVATAWDAHLIQQLRQQAVADKSFDKPRKVKPKPIQDTLAAISCLQLSMHRCPYYLAICNPFDTENALYTNDARQAIGFASTHKDPMTGNLILGDLYAVKAPYPTGSILLEMIISQAKELQLPAVELAASNDKAQKWYQKRAAFELIDETELYERRLILGQENFDNALKKLENITHVAFSDGKCQLVA